MIRPNDETSAVADGVLLLGVLAAYAAIVQKAAKSDGLWDGVAVFAVNVAYVVVSRLWARVDHRAIKILLTGSTATFSNLLGRRPMGVAGDGGKVVRVQVSDQATTDHLHFWFGMDGRGFGGFKETAWTASALDRARVATGRPLVIDPSPYDWARLREVYPVESAPWFVSWTWLSIYWVMSFVTGLAAFA